VVRQGSRDVKTSREIMEILEAYDLTGSYRAAAELAGCDCCRCPGWRHYPARRLAEPTSPPAATAVHGWEVRRASTARRPDRRDGEVSARRRHRPRHERSAVVTARLGGIRGTFEGRRRRALPLRCRSQRTVGVRSARPRGAGCSVELRAPARPPISVICGPGRHPGRSELSSVVLRWSVRHAPPPVPITAAWLGGSPPVCRRALPPAQPPPTSPAARPDLIVLAAALWCRRAGRRGRHGCCTRSRTSSAVKSRPVRPPAPNTATRYPGFAGLT